MTIVYFCSYEDASHVSVVLVCPNRERAIYRATGYKANIEAGVMLSVEAIAVTYDNKNPVGVSAGIVEILYSAKAKKQILKELNV